MYFWFRFSCVLFVSAIYNFGSVLRTGQCWALCSGVAFGHCKTMWSAHSVAVHALPSLVVPHSLHLKPWGNMGSMNCLTNAIFRPALRLMLLQRKLGSP